MTTESQEIAECVAMWLHYKSLTGLSDLLTEASMAVPIAEYLAKRYGKEVRTEVGHPCFSAGGAGRPKQLDFVRERHGEKTWHAAYETKFRTESFNLIVSDLCRLILLAQDKEIGNPSRFFVYASPVTPADPALNNSFNTGSGGRQSYFDDVLLRGKRNIGNEVKFQLSSLHERQRQEFRNFAKSNSKLLPSGFRIQLTGWYKTGGFVCGVWQLWAVRGSVLLSHQDI